MVLHLKCLGVGRSRPGLFAVILVLGCAVAGARAAEPPDSDAAVAQNLAEMLRAVRTVVSNNQDRINDPGRGDKGLGPDAVVEATVAIYRQSTGVDPRSLDPASRQGRLLRAELDAIADVMRANQETINKPGVGFKGFIPSAVARLVSEAFGGRAQGEAEIKVTAPPELIRNRKARPDPFEADVIAQKLSAADWPKGQFYAVKAEAKGRPAYRMLVPEYYRATCLSCHGEPKGEVDLTGYPKEGGKEGDLGGVISLTLYR
jgi:hypothetical protein